MAVIETLNLISETMDKLIDFVLADEILSKDFEFYLYKNKIEVEKQSEINAVLVEYILDGKMQGNTRVLDYYSQNNSSADKKIINSLKNSFISIFKVNKILKNAYQCTCLANEYDFELIPLVKMTNLRGVGLNDYIKARMIEIDNVFYLLEIFDCFGSFREHLAEGETIKCLIKYPESQTMYNKEKLLELENSVKKFNNKFLNLFKKDEIITSNSLADDFIQEFNLVIEDKKSDNEGEIPLEKYENYELTGEYFDIDENYEEDFIKNAKGGFKDSPKPYDIGFYMDKDLGLFVVPSLGSVNKILAENSFDVIKDGQKCIRNFVLSNKVSINLLIKKSKEYPCFISLINTVFDKKFQDIREVISYFKPDWILNKKFSPTVVLYNSKTFEKILNKENKKLTV